MFGLFKKKETRLKVYKSKTDKTQIGWAREVANKGIMFEPLKEFDHLMEGGMMFIPHEADGERFYYHLNEPVDPYGV